MFNTSGTNRLIHIGKQRKLGKLMTVELKDASPASRDEIEAMRQVLGVKLPAEFENFLLAHNGARPESNIFPVGSDNDSGVEYFIPCKEIVAEMKLIDHVSSKMIPIARDAGGNCVLLNVDDGGTIHFWDHEQPYEQVNLASNIDAFLELLKPFDEDSVEEPEVLSVWVDPQFLKELKEKGEID